MSYILAAFHDMRAEAEHLEEMNREADRRRAKSAVYARLTAKQAKVDAKKAAKAYALANPPIPSRFTNWRTMSVTDARLFVGWASIMVFCFLSVGV